jgi:hypothetical protein
MRSSIKIIYTELKVRKYQWCCCNVVVIAKTASQGYHPGFKSDVQPPNIQKPNDDIEVKKTQVQRNGSLNFAGRSSQRLYEFIRPLLAFNADIKVMRENAIHVACIPIL